MSRANNAMDFLDPEITFDPNKPFYGLVVAYLVQFHGLLDLAARSVSEGTVCPGNLRSATCPSVEKKAAAKNTKRHEKKISFL